MQNLPADVMKNCLIKFKNVCHDKYFLGIAVICAALLLGVLALLLPGQGKHFQAAHQELSILVENIRNHYKIRPDYWGLDTASAIKNNLVPENMLRNDKIVSTIGREIVLGQDTDGNMVMPGQRSFMLTLPNLSKTACVNMLSQYFNEETHLGLLKISLTTQENTQEFEWGGTNPLPISKKTAKQFCKNKNSLSWVFE